MCSKSLMVFLFLVAMGLVWCQWPLLPCIKNSTPGASIMGHSLNPRPLHRLSQKYHVKLLHARGTMIFVPASATTGLVKELSKILKPLTTVCTAFR
jgi:hypothetical protein